MLLPKLITPMRRTSLIAVAGLLAGGFAAGQTGSLSGPSAAPSAAPSIDQFTHSQFSGTGYSSSLAGVSASGLRLNEFSLPESSGEGKPAFGGGGGGQYGQGAGSGGDGQHGLFHHMAFEAGGGFNGPVGNDTPYITWGENFTVGAGFHFSRVFSTLLEYQFIDDKLPGAFISAVGTQSGDAHFNSITGSPVIDLTPKRSNGVYLVGGFGYYHKSTNFTDYECCDLYGYEVPETVLTITSNQWGGNGGLGIYHRIGGTYGDGSGQIFAEARYLYVHTPPISQSNGLGTTELIPVTVGIRF
jgi:hypothetical protein